MSSNHTHLNTCTKKIMLPQIPLCNPPSSSLHCLKRTACFPLIYMGFLGLFSVRVSQRKQESVTLSHLLSPSFIISCTSIYLPPPIPISISISFSLYILLQSLGFSLVQVYYFLGTGFFEFLVI